VKSPLDSGHITATNVSSADGQTVADPSKDGQFQIPPPPDDSRFKRDNAACTEPAPVFPPDRPALPGYEILGELGRGGMGVVYLARQRSLGREVALKVLRGNGGPSRQSTTLRFLAEAEAVAAISHPHVVRVFEFGEATGQPFMTLEYCAGGSLADRFQAGLLPERLAATLVEKLARGVGAAHERGIVHRDLKPSNVLFDAAGEPKVADFGLAKRIDSFDLTKTGDVFGTPAYMSPEQARGGSKFVGPPADVYALGIILYQAFTGTLPFASEDTVVLLQLVTSTSPVRPRERVKGISRDLETICLKCLEKEPHQRYATAAELADDLERFLSGQAVTARPIGSATRFVRWCRRNPAPATLLAGAIAVPAAAAIAFGIHTIKLRDAFDAKTAEERRTAAERDRADANYRHAKQAVRGMLARLSDRRYVDIPRVKELHNAQAEDALAYFRSIATFRDDASQELRGDSAQAELEAAKLCLAVGRRTEACEYADRARKVYIRLLDETPGNATYRFGRADATLTLVAATGHKGEKFDAAVQLNTETLVLLDTLVADPSSPPGVAESRATVANNLGHAYYDAGRYAAAEPHFRDAYERRAKLAAGRSVDRELTRQLAENALNLSAIFRQLGRPTEMAEFHHRAEASLDRLVAADPTDAAAVRSLAIERVNWSHTLIGEGKSDEAVESLTRMIPLLEALHRKEPADAKVRDALYRVHGTRGQLHEVHGSWDKALADTEKVVEFARSETKRFHQWFMNRTRLKAGDLKGALSEANELLSAAKTGVPHQEIYFQAATCAMIADRWRSVAAVLTPAVVADDLDRSERLAVQFLERAKSLSGPEEWSKIVPTLLADKNFVSLSSRNDFRSVVQPLQK
jgi:eukaryotic-like serine/threonine-protein kinase